MARTPDPFKPAEGVVFTNGEVNRAGQMLRRWYGRKAGKGLDDFDFSFDDLVEAMIAVTWWRSLHARPLSRVAANLRYHVGAEKAKVSGQIDITQRLKRRPTIFNKLEREPTMQLTQMQDIGGVRARLPSLSHLYAVSRRLRKTWTIVRTKDYVKSPRDSGYRAIHHIVRRSDRLVEVQLRTVLQDAWANQVEEDSRRLAVGYKFGSGEAEVHDYYRLFSEAFATLDREETLSNDLITAINESRERVADRLRRPPSKETVDD
jgi:ppGpp synthetase/RelA/SpoT-type nucleotidyltranferase